MLFTCKAWLTNRVRRSDVRNLDASDHLFLDDLLYISNVKMSKSSVPEEMLCDEQGQHIQ